MSGDTPTPKPSLDCPECGSKVFIRDTAAWFTDEEEHCAGCGSRVMVALDEDTADPDLLTARVYVYEHGGEVVARLRAEVDALTRETASLASDVGGLEFELLTAQTEAACLTGERNALERGLGNDWIGALSSDETDEEFIALATALDGTPGGEQ